MAEMTFYRFDADGANSDEEFGFAIANARDFSQDATEDFLYLDPDTCQWTSYSDSIDPTYNLDDAMQEMADNYEADSYNVLQDNTLTTVSIASSQIDRRSKLNDELEYGIDIDLNDMTVTGARKDVEAWQKVKNMKTVEDAIKTSGIVEPKWIEHDDIAILNNHKFDTVIQTSFDGKLHLYYDNIDYGAFDSIADAEDFYYDLHDTSLTSHSDEDFTDAYEDYVDGFYDVDEELEQNDDVEDIETASRTAGVWKLNLDAPITAQDKKTFLDNSVDVDQSETDDGHVILTMTGNDKVVADTAEFLGLTSDFAADAYTSSDTPEAIGKEAPIEDAETEQEAEEQEEDSEQKDKIKDDISSILESFKNEVSNRDASVKTSASTFNWTDRDGVLHECYSLKDLQDSLYKYADDVQEVDVLDLNDDLFTVYKPVNRFYWTASKNKQTALDPRRKFSSPFTALKAVLKDCNAKFSIDTNDYEQGELFASRQAADSAEVVHDTDDNKWNVVVKHEDQTDTNTDEDSAEDGQVEQFNTEQEADQYIENNNLEKADAPEESEQAFSGVSKAASSKLDMFSVKDADGCLLSVNITKDEDSLDDDDALYVLEPGLGEPDLLGLRYTNASIFKNEDRKYDWTVESDEAVVCSGQSDTFDEAEQNVYANLKEWLTDLAAQTSCQELDLDEDADLVNEDYDISYRYPEEREVFLI